jgi:hypothetical protein
MSRVSWVTRLGRGRVALGAAAVVVVAGGVALAAANRPDNDDIGAGERVVLYGDSLSVEAGPAFVETIGRLTRAEVEVQATPGIAPCDALDAMRADADEGSRPAVVVLQFAGNNATPCVAGEGGEPLRGPELAERYAADIRTAVELFAASDVRVVIAGPPPAPGLPGQATELIDEGYQALVTQWAGIDIGHVRYSPAGDTVAGDSRAYAARLPCLDGEGEAEGCDGGQIAVRSPDRIHLCPTELTDGLTCPVYSSGARRYGDEMARVAAQALDPAY